MNSLLEAKQIGVTKVGDKQSLKMTTPKPDCNIENVKALLTQALTEANRIKDDIKMALHTTH